MFFLPILAIAGGLGASTIGGVGVAVGGTAFGLSSTAVTAIGAATGGLIGNTIDKSIKSNLH